MFWLAKEDRISEEKLFWLSVLNLKDISYHGDSHETLDRVHVKSVLPKGAFMSKTVATFVQNMGLIWLKGGFIQDTNVTVGLKLFTAGTNVTTVLCSQAKKLRLLTHVGFFRLILSEVFLYMERRKNLEKIFNDRAKKFIFLRGGGGGGGGSP